MCCEHMPLTLTPAAGSAARPDGTAHHVHLSWSMQSSRQLALMLMLFHCHIIKKELLQLFLHLWRLCLRGLHPEAIGCEVVIAQQSMSNDWLADAAAVCAFSSLRLQAGCSLSRTIWHCKRHLSMPLRCFWTSILLHLPACAWEATCALRHDNLIHDTLKKVSLLLSFVGPGFWTLRKYRKGNRVKKGK